MKSSGAWSGSRKVRSDSNAMKDFAMMVPLFGIERVEHFVDIRNFL